MRIRPATPADVPGLFEVRTSVRENHMSMEELARIGVTPQAVTEMLGTHSRAWVAEEGGRIVAFSMADAARATVFAMFVRPEHEGRGLGRALMREAEAWLFSRGCPEIWLLTDGDPRVRANGFYRRLGWRWEGVEEDGQNRYTKRAPGARPSRWTAAIAWIEIVAGALGLAATLLSLLRGAPPGGRSVGEALLAVGVAILALEAGRRLRKGAAGGREASLLLQALQVPVISGGAFGFSLYAGVMAVLTLWPRPGLELGFGFDVDVGPGTGGASLGINLAALLFLVLLIRAPAPPPHPGLAPEAPKE